jgi:hypothetical protein
MDVHSICLPVCQSDILPSVEQYGEELLKARGVGGGSIFMFDLFWVVSGCFETIIGCITSHFRLFQGRFRAFPGPFQGLSELFQIILGRLGVVLGYFI